MKDPLTDNTMDESIDTTTKDSSGDTIIDTTTEGKQPDSSATEYDSDGNNLYGNDDQVSVSDKTTTASNESPNKGNSNKLQKSTSKRVAPIFEKNRKVLEYKTKFLYVAGIPVKKTKKTMEEYHRAIKDFLKEINEYDSTAILYKMYAASTPMTFEIKNRTNFPGKPSLLKTVSR